MQHERFRVLVVDDDQAARRAYREVLDASDDFQVAGEAVDGSQAVEAYEACHPHVVLMDLQMPRMSGVAATRALCERWPDACVVAVTTFGGREHVVAALHAGASGYLVKGITSAQLQAALHQALAGEMPLSSMYRRGLVQAVVADASAGQPAAHGLTAREVELVTWLAHGLTNRQIAARMQLSEGSVKQYVARASDKLGVVSRTQLLVRTIQLGIVDPATLPVTGGSVGLD